MTRHLFKLVWNRKRTNVLIILEIFFSFLVVFLVATLGIFFWDNYRRPLGFSYQNVWKVTVEGGGTEAPEVLAAKAKIFSRLLEEVERLGPVESAAGAVVSPYDQGGISGTWKIDGKDVKMEQNVVTPGLADVLGLRLVAGRWFQPADEALAYAPIVIDQDLAREVYGDQDPVGKQFGKPDPNERGFRVIGVVSEFRKSGELSPRANFMFRFLNLNAPTEPALPEAILVRVRPGTPAAFEEDLVRRLQGVAPEWSFGIKPLTQVREATLRQFLTPLVAGGIVAFFLLLMVGLGLIGVLWQNLLQRTRELGLRRAAGASRTAVHRQVFFEQVILTSLGVLLGAVLIVQLPIFDLIGFVRPAVYMGGFLVSVAAVYLLAVLCALYPSAVAARMQPAEALRYE